MESPDNDRPLSLRAAASFLLAYFAGASWCIATFVMPPLMKPPAVEQPLTPQEIQAEMLGLAALAGVGLVGLVLGILAHTEKEPERGLARVGLAGNAILLAAAGLTLAIALNLIE